MIFHLVPESDLVKALGADTYRPANLSEVGFVHCADEHSVLPVADDHFFDTTGRVVLLQIDPAKLLSVVRYEEPAPIQGSGSAHLETAALFPHVYGPIARAAIARVGVLVKSPEGFRWPTELVSLDVFVARS